MERADIIKFISQFPVYQFALLPPDEAYFSADIVKGCRNCRNYRTSWSCPPAIVSFDKCRRECMSYDGLFVFSTLYDPEKQEKQKSDPVKEHARITDLAAEFFRSGGCETYILSSSRCALCEKCTFPRKACLHQDRMRPCIESHGIKMGSIAAASDMDCFFEDGYALLFSLIFYRKEANV